MTNFEHSLGKNHPLLECYYTACFNKHHLPSLKSTLRALVRHPFTTVPMLAKLIYKRNYWSLAVDPDTLREHILALALSARRSLGKVTVIKQPHYRIPPLIHHLWLGSPFPEKYRAWARTWQQITGWEYRLWTDIDIEKLNLENYDRYRTAKNFGERSDIARYEILYRYGGLYIDTDFECLNPQQFDLLHRTYSFYGALQPLDINVFALANGCIGTAPNHPILRAIINYLKITPRGDEPVWMATGPVPFTRIVAQNSALLADSGVIFPPTVFFPITFTGIKHAGPETIAVHHWEASWK